MWIAGSGESPAPSEAPEDRPLLHPCLHEHDAVCQQETLAFIELHPPPATPKLNGLVIDTETRCTPPPPPPLNGFTHTLNELNSNSSEPECHNGVRRTSLQEQTERPGAVTTVCRPLHAALSLPLTFPLSCLRADRNSWESRLRCSSSSPELPVFQSPDACQLQRRTSQGSVKEKSIRRKMQVYSPDGQGDESLGSPILDADYIFPGPFASFLEEDLSGLSSLEADSRPSSTDGVTDVPNLCRDDIFNLPEEPLQIIEDSMAAGEDGGGSGETSSGGGAAAGGSFLSRGRHGDQERRRFSASELISRLQLSQRKSSFALKLGKSLSARVASRDRQGSVGLSPNAADRE